MAVAEEVEVPLRRFPRHVCLKTVKSYLKKKVTLTLQDGSVVPNVSLLHAKDGVLQCRVGGRYPRYRLADVVLVEPLCPSGFGGF